MDYKPVIDRLDRAIQKFGQYASWIIRSKPEDDPLAVLCELRPPQRGCPFGVPLPLLLRGTEVGLLRSARNDFSGGLWNAKIASPDKPGLAMTMELGSLSFRTCFGISRLIHGNKRC